MKRQLASASIITMKSTPKYRGNACENVKPVFVKRGGVATL